MLATVWIFTLLNGQERTAMQSTAHELRVIPLLLERYENAMKRAAAQRRARLSGRQAFSTAGPAGGQNAPSARTLHAGAESVFPGAVTLLGLVGLLRHGACARSSPSGSGFGSSWCP